MKTISEELWAECKSEMTSIFEDEAMERRKRQPGGQLSRG